jgi:hypothetical protein
MTFRDTTSAVRMPLSRFPHPEISDSWDWRVGPGADLARAPPSLPESADPAGSPLISADPLGSNWTSSIGFILSLLSWSLSGHSLPPDLHAFSPRHSASKCCKNMRWKSFRSYRFVMFPSNQKFAPAMQSDTPSRASSCRLRQWGLDSSGDTCTLQRSAYLLAAPAAQVALAAAMWSVNIAVANPMLARSEILSPAEGQRITASQLLYPQTL